MPTKKGIGLRIHQIKTLSNGMESKEKRKFEVASWNEGFRFG